MKKDFSEVKKRMGHETHEDIPPDRILEANKNTLADLVLCGFSTEGKFIMASSSADIRHTLYILRLMEADLMAREVERNRV